MADPTNGTDDPNPNYIYKTVPDFAAGIPLASDSSALPPSRESAKPALVNVMIVYSSGTRNQTMYK